MASKLPTRCPRDHAFGAATRNIGELGELGNGWSVFVAAQVTVAGGAVGSPPAWPDGRRFAFTIFDDPDAQSLAAGKAVYALLKDHGLRTTKGVWPIRGAGVPSDPGITCEDDGCVEWLQQLQADGFELGYHNATSQTSVRGESLRAIECFAAHFGAPPRAMANHYFSQDAIYWGSNRLTGLRRRAYDLLTLGRNRECSFGHVADHPYFWGDVCLQKLEYVRNFVFPDINTLNACPVMPYHDPMRPYVKYWYASTEGADAPSFIERVSERNLDRLEEEGGACIMYTHFGHGYFDRGKLDTRFRQVTERLSRRNGWFAPVSTVLDHLVALNGRKVITDAERRDLEWRWLWHKLRYGTA